MPIPDETVIPPFFRHRNRVMSGPVAAPNRAGCDMDVPEWVAG